MTDQTEDLAIYRLPDVERATGLKKTLIYDLEKRGDFPARIQLSSKSVGWLRSDINAWIKQRIAASAKKAA